MTQMTRDKHHKAGQTPPTPLDEVNKQRQKAEKLEVAGKHKNDGQKSHKGAR